MAILVEVFNGFPQFLQVNDISVSSQILSTSPSRIFLLKKVPECKG
jgi:hypothetical protein